MLSIKQAGREEIEMPNYCFNQVSIYSKDTDLLLKMRERLSDSFEQTLLDFMVPLPNGEWDYDWCVANWDTKWDVFDAMSSLFMSDSDGLHTLFISFNTAWTPPVQAFQRGAETHGFDFSLDYHEGGAGFVGRATPDSDECYDISFDRHPSEDIPNELLDVWREIVEDYEEYQANNQAEADALLAEEREAV